MCCPDPPVGKGLIPWLPGALFNGLWLKNAASPKPPLLPGAALIPWPLCGTLRIWPFCSDSELRMAVPVPQLPGGLAEDFAKTEPQLSFPLTLLPPSTGEAESTPSHRHLGVGFVGKSACSRGRSGEENSILQALERERSGRRRQAARPSASMRAGA